MEIVKLINSLEDYCRFCEEKFSDEEDIYVIDDNKNYCEICYMEILR